MQNIDLIFFGIVVVGFIVWAATRSDEEKYRIGLWFLRWFD